MGFIVVVDKDFFRDIPDKWYYGNVVSYKKEKVIGKNACIDYYKTFKEAKEQADLTKKITNKNYYNIRIYQCSKKDFDDFKIEMKINKKKILYEP